MFTDTDLMGSDVWVPRALYARAVPAASQVSFAALVTAAPGADLEALRGELTALVGPQHLLSVQDREQFKDAQAAQIDGPLAAVYALLALSVVIAAPGIVNILALSVFGRNREIGLLRAVGMTGWQLSRTITFESVLTALLGAVLGTAFGVTLAVLLQRVLDSQGLAELAVPGWRLAAIFALTGVVGVLTALLPADGQPGSTS